MAKKAELKVRFKNPWHSDKELYKVGREETFPAAIAKSLEAEGVVELLDAPEEKAE